MNDINLHNISKLELKPIKKYEKGKGEFFYCRHLIVTTRGQEFEISLFSDNKSDLNVNSK